MAKVPKHKVMSEIKLKVIIQSSHYIQVSIHTIQQVITKAYISTYVQSKSINKAAHDSVDCCCTVWYKTCHVMTKNS